MPTALFGMKVDQASLTRICNDSAVFLEDSVYLHAPMLIVQSGASAKLSKLVYHLKLQNRKLCLSPLLTVQCVSLLAF